MPFHAFTIDLEDWQQLLVRRITGQFGDPSTATIASTHRLLDLLDQTQVRATFFVVGILAERFPQLVREVHRRGHEIASHSYTHRPIFTLTADEFRGDVRRSIDQLSDLTGVAIRGFRAPEFSVGALDHWCFDVLAELGIEYDSSVFPIPALRYGIANAPKEPFRIETKAGHLWEFPLATGKWHGRTIPLAGGTYFRFLPQSTLRRAVKELDATSVFYFHPYEFHDQVLRLEDSDLSQRLSFSYVKYRLLHNFRTGRILRTLKPILTELEFRPLGETCDALRASTTT
jgi:polysaccharide deacetylase family protein (PEP-CTERM system associated)